MRRGLLVVAHLALLPLCAWALVEMLGGRSAPRIVVWLIACVAVHDLVLFPLYSGADRGLRRLFGDALNYVRIPAALSVLSLVVFWGTIAERGEPAYRATSGRTFDGHATRWLLMSAALFAGSGALYLLRRSRS